MITAAPSGVSLALERRLDRPGHANTAGSDHVGALDHIPRREQCVSDFVLRKCCASELGSVDDRRLITSEKPRFSSATDVVNGAAAP